ncbi:MAG: Flp pilus assembly protein CpaB [Bryobacterales bacterium]|nr:Flp pilus assembly protein CpaB [Bryobacterales bacterium]
MSAKKKSLVPLFGVAFIVAILSTGIFYGLFVGQLDSATSVKATGTVVVAARAIPSGTILNAGDVKTVPWASEVRPAGAIPSPEEAAGKVVAIALAENELITQGHLGQRDGGSKESGGLGIPEGMRAVSIQVQDSSGVVSMLKPGLKVDVQVVASVNTGQYHEPHIRTVLENMQVLTVPPEGQSGRAQVLTLLANPREAAVLGLADSTAKVRVVLRNPIDQKRDNLGAVGLTSVFSPGMVAPPGVAPVTVPPSAVAPASALAPTSGDPAKPAPANAPAAFGPGAKRGQSEVQLLVRLAGIGGQAEKELSSKLDGSATQPDESLQVAAVRPDAGLEAVWQKWESEKAVETLASSRLLVSYKMLAGAQWSFNENRYGLRVQFAPIAQAGPKVRLRVNPEVTYPNQSGMATRRVETEIEVGSGQSFLVKGLVSQPDTPALWEKLFPGRAPVQEGHGLILLVTPKLAPRV